MKYALKICHLVFDPTIPSSIEETASSQKASSLAEARDKHFDVVRIAANEMALMRLCGYNNDALALEIAIQSKKNSLQRMKEKTVWEN